MVGQWGSPLSSGAEREVGPDCLLGLLLSWGLLFWDLREKNGVFCYCDHCPEQLSGALTCGAVASREKGNLFAGHFAE